MDDQYYKKNSSAPVLFYCGNEAPVDIFYNNSGFLSYTLAKKYHGLVVFAEHRYFGNSTPMGWNITEAH